MSVATEIQRLQNAKTSIKTAIENKGVTVGDGTLDTYASKIDSIEVGGSSEMNAKMETVPTSTKAEDIVRKLIKTIPAIDTSNLTSMYRMFAFCNNVESIDCSNYNTSKVTNMQGVFYNCVKLPSIDVSSFDTSKVTMMTEMFSTCNSIKTLDLSNFVTTNLTNISTMFSSCWALENIDLSSFDTSKVNNMSSLFFYCYALEPLDISNFDASKVANVRTMFRDCKALKNLKFMRNLGKGYTLTTANYSSYKLELETLLELTHDSLMSVINNLYDLNLTYNVANGGTLYTQQLVLGSTNISKLSASELEVCTQKGWVVS